MFHFRKFNLLFKGPLQLFESSVWVLSPCVKHVALHVVHLCASLQQLQLHSNFPYTVELASLISRPWPTSSFQKNSQFFFFYLHTARDQ